MVKKLFKVLFTAIITFSILSLTASAEEQTEYEPVVLNSTTVKYNFGGSTVYMPTEYVVDSDEMRGAWVATVWNNDMPQQNGTGEAAINEYKQAFLAVLDTLEKYNMNTVFFQVRPCNDAFYESDYNDWSKFLVGTGVNPGWNPLEWMVEETHKRDMYFQCWMNAFRVTETEIFSKDAISYTDQELIDAKKKTIAGLADNNFAKLHPELVVMGDKDSKLILNPAELQVQEHILNTIRELITEYDVDGCHFDDYFYLSPRSADGINPQITNLAFAGGTSYNETFTGANTMNDLGTYKDYNADPAKYDLPAGLTLGEFRRQSLNNLMKNIRALVDEVNETYNKTVEFGSKPTAVWQSNSAYCNDAQNTSPDGSNTHCGAYNSNYTLFADTKYWVENGYVDWIAPQVYYGFENNEAPYADIVKWWADIVTKTNEKRQEEGKEPIKMYVAHGIYKFHDSGSDYNDSNEVEYQMRYNQMFDCIKGSAVYAYTDLVVFNSTLHKTGIGTKLYVLWKNNPVLPHPNGELDYNDLEIKDLVIRETATADTYNISFPQVEHASMYQVYIVPKTETLDLNNTKHRMSIIKGYQFASNISIDLKQRDNYDYYIQAVSDNYYPSTKAIKVNFDNVKLNNAPSTVEIAFNKKVLGTKELLEITIPYATDLDGDSLTYSLKAGFSGVDGTFTYDLSNIKYNDNNITAEFQGFGAKTESFVVRLEISDGIDTTVVYSDLVTFTNEVSSHTHTACPECGLCTSSDCDGKDTDKCQGHEEHIHTECPTCGLCTSSDCDGNDTDKCPGHKTDGGNSGSSCNFGAYMILPLTMACALVLIRKRD